MLEEGADGVSGATDEEGGSCFEVLREDQEERYLVGVFSGHE